jgi:hypothetical protein
MGGVIAFGEPPPRHVVDNANCKGRGHLFIMPPPGRRTAATNQRLAAAYQLCDTCPVLQECRAWALGRPDPAFGLIAGGLAPHQRAALRGPYGSRPPRALPAARRDA